LAEEFAPQQLIRQFGPADTAGTQDTAIQIAWISLTLPVCSLRRLALGFTLHRLVSERIELLASAFGDKIGRTSPEIYINRRGWRERNAYTSPNSLNLWHQFRWRGTPLTIVRCSSSLSLITALVAPRKDWLSVGKGACVWTTAYAEACGRTLRPDNRCDPGSRQ
jgi:hypothetical protein